MCTQSVLSTNEVRLSTTNHIRETDRRAHVHNHNTATPAARQDATATTRASGNGTRQRAAHQRDERHAQQRPSQKQTCARTDHATATERSPNARNRTRQRPLFGQPWNRCQPCCFLDAMFWKSSCFPRTAACKHKQLNSQCTKMPSPSQPVISRAQVEPTCSFSASRRTPISRAMLSIPMTCCAVKHVAYNSASPELIAMTVWFLLQLRSMC